MDDKPSFDEVEQESDPVGDMETRKVQSMGRVDVKDEYLEQIGVDEGDKVFIICEENEVRIIKATKENMMKHA